jgi:hypothetical protein
VFSSLFPQFVGERKKRERKKKKLSSLSDQGLLLSATGPFFDFLCMFTENATHTINAHTNRWYGPGLPDFSLFFVPKQGEIYQIATTYINYQIATKYI